MFQTSLVSKLNLTIFSMIFLAQEGFDACIGGVQILIYWYTRPFFILF